MAAGAIKWFHAVMDCGVVAPDDGSPGVPVRVPAAEADGPDRFREGDRLEHDMVQAANERPLAVDPRLAKEGGRKPGSGSDRRRRVRITAAGAGTDGAEQMAERHPAQVGREPEGDPETEAAPETAAERDERRRAVENDRVASRRATEGSRGKRRRGGGLGSEGPL